MSITKQDLQQLPWRYQVAIAVRAAQRVAPLLRLTQQKHRAAVAGAVQLAEAYAHGATELAQFYASAKAAAVLAENPQFAGLKLLNSFTAGLSVAEDAACKRLQRDEHDPSLFVVNAVQGAHGAAHSAAFMAQTELSSGILPSYANSALVAAEAAACALAAPLGYQLDSEEPVREASWLMEEEHDGDFAALLSLAQQRGERPETLGQTVDVRKSGVLGPLWSGDRPAWWQEGASP